MNLHDAHPLPPSTASVDIYHRERVALQSQAFQSQLQHPYAQPLHQLDSHPDHPPQSHPHSHYHTHHHLYAPTPHIPLTLSDDLRMNSGPVGGRGRAGVGCGYSDAKSQWVAPHSSHRPPQLGYGWRRPSGPSGHDGFFLGYDGHNHSYYNNKNNGGCFFEGQQAHNAFDFTTVGGRSGDGCSRTHHVPSSGGFTSQNAPNHNYGYPLSSGALAMSAPATSNSSTTLGSDGSNARGEAINTSGGYMYENTTPYNPPYSHNGPYNGPYIGPYSGSYNGAYNVQHSHPPVPGYYGHMPRHHAYQQQYNSSLLPYQRSVDLPLAMLNPFCAPHGALSLRRPATPPPPPPADINWDSAYASRVSMSHMMGGRMVEQQQQQQQQQRYHHLFQYEGHTVIETERRKQQLQVCDEQAATPSCVERQNAEADAGTVAGVQRAGAGAEPPTVQSEMRRENQTNLCQTEGVMVDPPTTSPPLISATGTDSGISNCSARLCSESVSLLSMDVSMSVSCSPHAPQIESTTDDEVSDILVQSEGDNCNDVDSDGEDDDEVEGEDDTNENASAKIYVRFQTSAIGSAQERPNREVMFEHKPGTDTAENGDIRPEGITERAKRSVYSNATTSTGAASQKTSETSKSSTVASEEIEITSHLRPWQPPNTSLRMKQGRKREHESSQLHDDNGTFMSDNGNGSSSSNSCGSGSGIHLRSILVKRSRVSLKGIDQREREDEEENRPLPGFQQAFGSTEIGRFSGTFPQAPNPTLNFFCQAGRENSLPLAGDSRLQSRDWDTHESYEASRAMHTGSKPRDGRPFAALGDLVEFERRQGRSYLKYQK